MQWERLPLLLRMQESSEESIKLYDNFSHYQPKQILLSLNYKKDCIYFSSSDPSPLQKTVIETKTTEYMPASMQFGILFIVAQWTLFGVLSGNMYMAVSHISCLF